MLQADGRRFGLVVDRVLNTEEIVVKPLGGQLKDIGLYAGATILGDGTVALILDVRRSPAGHLRAETAERSRTPARQAASAATETDRRAAAGRRHRRRPAGGDPAGHGHPARGVPRRRASSRSAPARSSSTAAQILPLVRLAAPAAPTARRDREVLAVVVYSDDGRSVALVVERIVDIAENEAAIRRDIDDDGLLGTAVLGDG